MLPFAVPVVWRLSAAAAVVVAAFVAGVHWEGGRAAQRAAVVESARAQRDAASAAAFAQAVRERDDAEQAAAAANRRIVDELEPKLAAADAAGRRLARLLHDALAAEPRGGAAAPTADQPGVAQPAGEPGGQGTIAGPVERGLADYDAACQRDALRLAALQAEVRAQL